jgi:hypothetical protein
MQSDSTYYVLAIAMALAVILICGGGITWNYFSATRWGERKGRPTTPEEHQATSVFADPRPAEVEVEVEREVERRTHDLAA